jgi:hypothetical protein
MSKSTADRNLRNALRVDELGNAHPNIAYVFEKGVQTFGDRAYAAAQTQSRNEFKTFITAINGNPPTAHAPFRRTPQNVLPAVHKFMRLLLTPRAGSFPPIAAARRRQ